MRAYNQRVWTSSFSTSSDATRKAKPTQGLCVSGGCCLLLYKSRPCRGIESHTPNLSFDSYGLFTMFTIKSISRWTVLISASLSVALVQVPTSMEVDIAFPRPNGRYARTDHFPVVLAIQNTAAAFEFGYGFSWLIVPADPDAFGIEGQGDIFVVEETSPPSTDPYIQTNYTAGLDVGQWNLSWTLTNARTCVDAGMFVDETFFTTINNGSFTFTIADGAPSPKFAGSCPSPLGVVSYSTVETYSVVSGYNICPVTASVAPSASPCRVTINDAQESSIYKALDLSVITAPTTTSSSSSTTQSATSSEATTSLQSSIAATSTNSTLQGSASASTTSKPNVGTVKSSSIGFLIAMTFGAVMDLVVL